LVGPDRRADQGTVPGAPGFARAVDGPLTALRAVAAGGNAYSVEARA
jgi:hypothetical protein